MQAGRCGVPSKYLVNCSAELHQFCLSQKRRDGILSSNGSVELTDPDLVFPHLRRMLTEGRQKCSGRYAATRLAAIGNQYYYLPTP